MNVKMRESLSLLVNGRFSSLFFCFFSDLISVDVNNVMYIIAKINARIIYQTLVENKCQLKNEAVNAKKLLVA